METTIIDDLFGALNLAGLQSNQKTALLVGVGLVLGFTAYKFVKKVAGRL